MLIDARTLPPEEELAADVCVIGAGPAGIVLTRELAQRGVRVCVLESGGREPAPGTGGESVGYPYYTLETARRQGFGGTSHAWGLGTGDYWHSAPLDRLDFERRDGIARSGWPFSRTVLTPFYERAALYADSVPFVYSPDPAGDADAAQHLPVRPGSVVSTFFQLSTGTFRGSFDELARSPNVSLVLHATAADLGTSQDARRLSRVQAYSAPGRRLSVRARATVLAAGGIENPRLLLLSTGARPRGLGNDNDLVGRTFMEHLAVRSGVVVPSGPAVMRETQLYARREQDGGSVQPVLRLHEDVVRSEQLLSVALIPDARPRAAAAEGVRSLSVVHKSASVRPRPRGTAGHVRNVVRDLPDVVRSRYLRRDAAPDVLLLAVQAEQAPDPASRVTLGDTRDEYGLRRPRLDWRLSELDRRSVRRTQELLDEELRLAGLGHVEDFYGDERPPALVIGLGHHMGTTRMDPDASRGVVDTNCRVHGTENLFVTGSSVFPTGGWANPTLTVIALAIRLADHLLATLPLS